MMKALPSCENARAWTASQNHARETGLYCHNWEAIIEPLSIQHSRITIGQVFGKMFIEAMAIDRQRY